MHTHDPNWPGLSALALIGVGLALTVASPSYAGRHAGATLIAHADPITQYTADLDYAGASDLSDCHAATTELGGEGIDLVWWVSAVLPEGSEPRVSAVSFGVEYPWPVHMIDWGSSGTSEDPLVEWPQTNSGTTVYFENPETNSIVEVYWFAGYYYPDFAGLEDITFDVVAHPNGAATIVDDSNPPETDRVYDLGSLGFAGEPGTAPCPATPTEGGACCFLDSSCGYLDEFTCFTEDGMYAGDGTVCNPDPCVLGPGACCLEEPACLFLTEDDCLERGGKFQGSWITCEDAPCGVACQPSADVRSERSTLRGAGPNAGGTLILHIDEQIVYSSGEDYCRRSELNTCSEAIARSDGMGPIVFHALAAFEETASPRLSGISFGIEYADCFELLDWGSCADFEISENAWPGSGSGTALSWADPETGTLTEVYWFAGYVEAQPGGRLRAVPHPVQGAFFADDDIPSNLDPIAGLGALGFSFDGWVPCPIENAGVGACCLASGCEDLSEEACLDAGGRFIGSDVRCADNPCVPTVVIERSWGSIKQNWSR